MTDTNTNTDNEWTENRTIGLLGIMLIIVSLALIIVSAVLFTSDDADAATYEPCTGQIVGSTAEVTGDCILLAYRYADGAPGPDQLSTSLPQTLVSSDDTSEDGHLSVEVPNCFWQIDLVQQGADIANPLTTEHHYSDQGMLVAYQHGGTTACETVIVTTTTSTTVPETTTTTAPEPTTTTVVQPTTTVPAPSTTVGTPTTPAPATQLARTGSNGGLSGVAIGFMLAGIGLVLLGADKRTGLLHR